MQIPEGDELIILRKRRVVFEILVFQHERVEGAALRRGTHLGGGHGDKGDVALERRKAAHRLVRKDVAGGIAVQQRHQEVHARRAGKGVRVAHDELIVRRGLRQRLDARLAVAFHQRAVRGFRQHDAGVVFHQRFRRVGGGDALGIQHFDRERAGGRNRRGHIFAGGDVIDLLAGGDCAQTDRDGLSVHRGPAAVKGVDHVAQEPVVPGAGLFRG